MSWTELKETERQKYKDLVKGFSLEVVEAKIGFVEQKTIDKHRGNVFVFSSLDKNKRFVEYAAKCIYESKL